MVRMESTDGYEQKLLVTIQKYSDSRIQVVYWGNSSQINVNDICIYNPYDEDDLAAFEEKNVQWVEDENCESSYIPVITGNPDGMEIKTCDYFEPGCDVSKWQKPVLTARIDVMVSDILNLVVSDNTWYHECDQGWDTMCPLCNPEGWREASQAYYNQQ